MAETLLSGYSQLAVNVATATAASGVVGAAFSLVQADSYQFILDIGAVTGTSPTADFELEFSPNSGTTYYAFARFAQMTATGTRRIIIQPIQGRGEAGTEAAITTHGTNSALNANVPLPNGFGAYFQLYATLGGTSPSIASVKLWVIAQPKATAV